MFSQKKSSLFISILSLVFLTQCASSNFTGMDSTYSLMLGNAEQNAYKDLVTRLQNSYQYQIQREDVYSNDEVFVRTYWKKHPPFTSDSTFKAKNVETRVILRTRSRNRQGYQLFSIKLTGEYRVLMPTESGETEYQVIEITDAAEEYFDNIATDFKDRLSGSIRG